MMKHGVHGKVHDAAQQNVHQVDTTKLLPNHITALVDDVNEKKNCVWIAVEKSFLKCWYHFMRVTVKRCNSRMVDLAVQ
jgi:hypothetical protein